MKNRSWKPYIVFVALTEAVGALAGWLTRDGMASFQTVQKSALTPPDAVFPIVWTVLYALMGIGAARVWQAPASRDRARSLRLFALQLAVNFFWSFLFFNLQAYGLSFVWLILLWILVFCMIQSFRKVDQVAAWMQLPYLLWITFAGYLNFMVWFLNR